MLTLSSCFVLLFLYVVGACLQSSQALEHCHDYHLAKTALVEKLTTNSSINKLILPVVDGKSAVKLEVEISLRQIATLDEVNQAIRLNLWLRLFWNNPILQWDTKHYRGIKSLHLDSESFWTPDIALFNKASLEEDIDILYKRLGTNLIIDNNGNCTWLNPVTLLAQCRIDVSRFPFDKQDCPLTLGSWTHTKYEIDIMARRDKVELDSFIPSGEWEVLSANLQTNTKYYGVDKAPYSDVTMNLHIKRRPLYYGFNLIIPCALIDLLSLAAFLLPSNHGERISLVITVLLANSVYMLIVSSSLPQTSDSVPVVVAYFLCIIIKIALSLYATCFTLNVCAKYTEMPYWVETVVNRYLARLVFIAPEPNTTHVHENGTRDVRERFLPETQKSDMELIEIGFQSNSKQGSDKEATLTEVLEIQFVTQIRCLTNEVRLRQSREYFARKWKRAAKVLDRLFLFFFVFIYLVLTAYLLASM